MTVRVDIAQDLLREIENPPPVSKTGYIERCERHKRFFAHLAAMKYCDGQYKPEVGVLVVRITEDDLA
jgi:hypothetical protein